ncbi:hypothetical protein HSBAA_59100 [Vreelandella sulfidaeris]|uniref:Uncharacterized protein n=1 Tax=Vreelandella sulfidaeris TaxID=115553 RepID=A0A455UNS8_9GAMM|nr:hypothetical protein HSBAA_59100 [Halomonas sulfidaeris]
MSNRESLAQGAPAHMVAVKKSKTKQYDRDREQALPGAGGDFAEGIISKVHGGLQVSKVSWS